MELFIPAILTIITAATPLLFAALGEMVTEKSGVLNLGVEGMMVMGAIMGFVSVHTSGSITIAILASIFSGMVMAAIFALLVLKFHASQVPTGLALTIFGIGLSALVGQSMIGIAYEGIPKVSIPLLSSIPLIGEIFFQHDILVYLSIIMVVAVYYFLTRTRSGLILRAVGDSHDAAHAMGYSVVKIRFLAILFGGAMSGLGGAYLSLSYSPLWVEQMTAGRGWIALALVVFATWRPMRVLMGAYLFGGITILQLHAQALGIAVPSQVMSMLPYLATVVVLVIISSDQVKIKLNAPASLGRAFHPSR
jgi:general nucleoside transport system permease protein